MDWDISCEPSWASSELSSSGWASEVWLASGPPASRPPISEGFVASEPPSSRVSSNTWKSGIIKNQLA